MNMKVIAILTEMFHICSSPPSDDTVVCICTLYK